MDDLIKQLLDARKKKGITQSTLARSVGLPQSHISSIEQGKVDIRVSTLLEMARILDHEVVVIPREHYSLLMAIIEGKKDIELEPLWKPDEED